MGDWALLREWKNFLRRKETLRKLLQPVTSYPGPAPNAPTVGEEGGAVAAQNPLASEFVCWVFCLSFLDTTVSGVILLVLGLCWHTWQCLTLKWLMLGSHVGFLTFSTRSLLNWWVSSFGAVIHCRHLVTHIPSLRFLFSCGVASL